MMLWDRAGGVMGAIVGSEGGLDGVERWSGLMEWIDGGG